MQLQQVLRGLDYQFQGEFPEIRGISCDSRIVQPGDLFVAISGQKVNGHNFVHEAEQRGAKALLVEKWIANCNLPQILVRDTRFALGIVSSNFHANPGQKLKVLGVTGTNGKTTCTYLVKSILEKAGYKVGLIGTIHVLIGEHTVDVPRTTPTTPESLDLQRILAKMVDEQVDFVIMEVSSHALESHRTAGLTFAGALFTNLSQDHLDFHETMEQYFAAKAKLFQAVRGASIINIDDPWGERLESLCSGSVLTYGVEKEATFQAQKIQLENSGVSYILSSEVGQVSINLQLTGYFNVYNSLGAAALCYSQGIPIDKIKTGLQAVPGVPGRLERVENDRHLNVFVDYAHSPDGLENVLRSARELALDGKIILVFGAGGDRDKTKRPLMGAIAARLADRIIITSDNPRTEDPAQICSSIESGLLEANPKADYMIIVNRRDAIRKAVEIANPADLVIIAGKGHETYQEFAHGKVHFDDGEEVRVAIKELKD